MTISLIKECPNPCETTTWSELSRGLNTWCCACPPSYLRPKRPTHGSWKTDALTGERIETK